MFPWCGIPAFLVASQRTLKQARIDVADSFWYRNERHQERIALAEFRKKSKKKGAKRIEVAALVTPEPLGPRGRGLTHRSDKSQAKKLLKQ